MTVGKPPKIRKLATKELNMNLLEFVKEFPDEASCRKKFKEYREQVGVVCQNAEERIITGSLTRENMNVRSAKSAKVYVQGQ